MPEDGPASFTLLGVGAMNSPRYAPAGLLIERGHVRVAIDGGPGAEPEGPLAAWLVTDQHAELIAALRRLAAARGLVPEVGAYRAGGLDIAPYPVVHTSHPTCGYLIEADGRRIVWAPEFLEFPAWAAGADLMFADAAGWARPIRFARGPAGTHRRWPSPNRPPATAYGAWCSRTSAAPHRRAGRRAGAALRRDRRGRRPVHGLTGSDQRTLLSCAGSMSRWSVARRTEPP